MRRSCGLVIFDGVFLYGFHVYTIYETPCLRSAARQRVSMASHTCIPYATNAVRVKQRRLGCDAVSNARLASRPHRACVYFQKICVYLLPPHRSRSEQASERACSLFGTRAATSAVIHSKTLTVVAYVIIFGEVVRALDAASERPS